MGKHIVILMLVVMPVVFSGCASIVSRKTYPISINSRPDSALITVTDIQGQTVFKGVTPAAVVLKASSGFFKKAHYFVKFEKEGYENVTASIKFKMDGWYWGNFLFGGVIGLLIIDPATGAMYKLDTQFVFETLVPSTKSADNSELRIHNINDIPSEWEEHLVLITK